MNNENKLKQTAESNHGEIALLASQIWEREGKPSGRDEEIWLQAEAQLFAVRKSDAESAKVAESKRSAASGRTKPSTEPRMAVVEKAWAPPAPASVRKNGVKR
jgi:Protein of unknown function (DUF2934)